VVEGVIESFGMTAAAEPSRQDDHRPYLSRLRRSASLNASETSCSTGKINERCT
jgi:hypothetical protein